MRNFFKKSTYIVALLLVLIAVISCEKDFTDIGSSIINNTKFSTGAVNVDIEVQNSNVPQVISDNISSEPGVYLLGVYANDDYQNIQASIVSQLRINTDLQVVDDENVYGSDTTVVTTIDTVFLKLPYQVKLNDEGTAYELDSIIGDQSEAFTFNVYQTNKYLSSLNPDDPSKINSYSSSDEFEKKGLYLNSQMDFQFLPELKDTVIVKRWSSNNILYSKDTLTYTASSSSDIALPFAVVPLKEDVFKELFLDKYESSDFASQDAFNNYFRGVILEAKGDKGSLISFNFNSSVVNPSIEVYYTNTVLTGGEVIDNIAKNDSFLLAGIRASTYTMEEDKVYSDDEIKLQGTAGNEAVIDLFGADVNNNGVADKIEELRERNLLINDASLTFYVNQEKDATDAPYQLYLYKSDEKASPSFSQVKDTYTEGITTFGGLLETDDNGEQKYTFKITDYVSDLLSGETDYSPKLRLKVMNSTDLQVTDTIFRNYSWNPKAVTLFNHSSTHGDKKAQLKISYSEKQD